MRVRIMREPHKLCLHCARTSSRSARTSRRQKMCAHIFCRRDVLALHDDVLAQCEHVLTQCEHVLALREDVTMSSSVHEHCARTSSRSASTSSRSAGTFYVLAHYAHAHCVFSCEPSFSDA